MASAAPPVKEPVPISMVAGRFLLFDINVVTYLRSTHHICGVLIGSIPQIPQQNVFLGLPVELLPEEARILIDKKAAYIVDDAPWHKAQLSTLSGTERTKYLASLKSEGRKAQKTAERESQKRMERGLARQALVRAPKHTSRKAPHHEHVNMNGQSCDTEGPDPILFEDDLPTSPLNSTASTSASSPYSITTTTSYLQTASCEKLPIPVIPVVPTSYPIYAHLHAQQYFITPGLRFGCDYTVYPGDPLRFHSHFLAVGYDWHEEIPLLDLVGGGRLGTGVKKGFLIGGQDPDNASSEPFGNVRTFCIEWGGM
ncbi:MAG: tRNA-splicing endonuclease subunit [Claussenomyces sp. TS43310]|nr:MAG: tRNA-splicing endonuclease subunit [Claussenomyces sp. TS43310]